jgi:hypothetical protein
MKLIQHWLLLKLDVIFQELSKIKVQRVSKPERLYVKNFYFVRRERDQPRLTHSSWVERAITAT